jgi:hypothetical protein
MAKGGYSNSLAEFRVVLSPVKKVLEWDIETDGVMKIKKSTAREDGEKHLNTFEVIILNLYIYYSGID